MLYHLFSFMGSMVSGLISLGIYIITAYAFYKVAKLRGLSNAWLAFIPIFQLYIIGSIADTMKYNHYRINRYISDIPLAYALPLLSLASGLLGALPLIGGILAVLVELALWGAQLLVYYFVFSLYGEPKDLNLFTVLSVIPFVGPCLMLYVLRDRRC